MISRSMIVRGRTFEWGARTYIMGVINLTPDSFSGDGLLSPPAETGSKVKWLYRALEQARQFVRDGADILDVGGESTRPGAQPVQADEELGRIAPLIRLLRTELDVLVSVDTYKAVVAEAALAAGADMVNDIWGFKADPKLAEVTARWQVPVILMHNRSSWANAEIKERLGGRYVGVPYTNLVEDILFELQESIDLARSAGIPPERIILDPGIGFGKTVEQNLELVRRLDEIRHLGYPVLLGPSRKSFIGYTLNLPPDERLEGTIAACVVGIWQGADILRVHDVLQVARAARMTDALLGRGIST